jgi:hypothetical protein
VGTEAHEERRIAVQRNNTRRSSSTLNAQDGGAHLEIDASVAAFERLGSRLDLVRARALAAELRTIACRSRDATQSRILANVAPQRLCVAGIDSSTEMYWSGA